MAETKALLLVDNDEQVLKLLEHIIRGMGYSMILAASAEEALISFDAGPEHIQLVITDLEMPGMGGYAFIKELRQHDPVVPILVSTGSCTPEQRSLLMQQGVTCILLKPYGGAKLRNAIRAVLEWTEPR